MRDRSNDPMNHEQISNHGATSHFLCACGSMLVHACGFMHVGYGLLCASVCIYRNACGYTWVYVWVYDCVCMHDVYICTNINVHIWLFFMYTCVYVYLWTYTCMCEYAEHVHLFMLVCSHLQLIKLSLGSFYANEKHATGMWLCLFKQPLSDDNIWFNAILTRILISYCR